MEKEKKTERHRRKLRGENTAKMKENIGGGKDQA